MMTNEMHPLDRPIPVHSGQPGLLRVVVVFGDFKAGRRASFALARILSTSIRSEATLAPSYWSFDLLADHQGYAAALSDAVRADLIIVATSEPQLSPPAAAWMEDALAHHSGREFSYIALVGLEKPWVVRVVKDPPAEALPRLPSVAA